jgi:MYXO-CTERM domain-containing protein
MTTRSKAAGIAVSAVTLLAAHAGPAHAQSVDAPVDGGDVTIVNEAREELSEGSGGTVFGLELPAGSSCPGDSRNDQWRIQTFVVPAEIDPGELTYTSTGPDGEGLYALYSLDTNQVADRLTAPNGAPGLPGLITGLPGVSFEIFPPGTLPDGTYRIGIACTLRRDTAIFWDTELQIERDPDDQPAEMRWTVGGASSANTNVDRESSSGGASSGVAVAAVAAALALGGFFVIRSRRRPAQHQEAS